MGLDIGFHAEAVQLPDPGDIFWEEYLYPEVMDIEAGNSISPVKAGAARDRFGASHRTDAERQARADALVEWVEAYWQRHGLAKCDSIDVHIDEHRVYLIALVEWATSPGYEFWNHALMDAMAEGFDEYAVSAVRASAAAENYCNRPESSDDDRAAARAFARWCRDYWSSKGYAPEEILTAVVDY